MNDLTIFDTLQLALVIPKMLQCICWVILAIIILKKSNYVLNKIFFIAFVGGALFALCDAIIYAVAPNGDDWLLLANIMRDVSIIGFMTMNISLYFASIVIKHSYESISKAKKTRLEIYFVLLCILTIIFDRISVFNINTSEEILNLPPITNEIKVTAYLIPASIILYLIALSFLFRSVSNLFKLYIQATNPVTKKRMKNFLLGIVIEFGSYLFFLILTILKLRLLYLYWFGYIIAIFSPILILMGFNVKEK